MRLTDLEENAVEALDYTLQSLNVRVTTNSVREKLYLHPDFPSLASLSDVLNELKVPNVALRMSPQQLSEVPLPAIVFIENEGGYFAPVRKVSHEIEWLNNKTGWKKEPLHTFSQKWNGISLLIEPNHESGERNYIQHRNAEFLNKFRIPTVILGIIGVVFVTFFSMKNPFNEFLWLSYSLLTIKIVGTFVTTLLLWSGIDSENKIIRTVCNIDNSNHCNDILQSKSAKIFDLINWSEIGFVYFFGGFLSIVCSFLFSDLQILYNVVIFNFISIPYTFYSVYHQGVVLKKWCVLCIIVQILLWIGDCKLNCVTS